MGSILQTLTGIISRTRRNHALEHATIHILTRKFRDVNLYARSSYRGLVIYGDLPTEEVANAVSEALARLRNGEYHLAVHPNCGTNLVTAGGLSSMAAMLAFAAQRGGKKKQGVWHTLGSLPLVVLAATVALVAAQPLGQSLQINLTTESEMGDLHITGVTCHRQGRLVLHTVQTADL